VNFAVVKGGGFVSGVSFVLVEGRHSSPTSPNDIPGGRVSVEMAVDLADGRSADRGCRLLNPMCPENLGGSRSYLRGSPLTSRSLAAFARREVVGRAACNLNVLRKANSFSLATVEVFPVGCAPGRCKSWSRVVDDFRGVVADTIESEEHCRRFERRKR